MYVRPEAPSIAIINIDLNRLILGSTLRICLAYLTKPNKYTQEIRVNCIRVNLEALRYNTANGPRGKLNPTLNESMLNRISSGEVATT